MRIGIDLHGVIDSDPDWFSHVLGWFLLDCDACEICIVSGPPKADIEAELAKMGIHQGSYFDEIYSVVDHLKEKGVEMWQDEKNTWWTYPETWWKAKAEICEKHNIDIMIDDREEWGEQFKYVKTKFLLYKG